MKAIETIQQVLSQVGGIGRKKQELAKLVAKILYVDYKIVSEVKNQRYVKVGDEVFQFTKNSRKGMYEVSVIEESQMF